MTLRPCIDCGEPVDQPRCPECAPPVERERHNRKSSPRARGYDSQWDRLSKRARKLQPFCADCGSPHDLTTDHSPEAWEARENGKSIKLAMVSVLCRSCNARKGASR